MNVWNIFLTLFQLDLKINLCLSGILSLPVISCCFLMITGPNRTALQSMLAKLEGEEETPAPAAPATPAPANQNISRPNSTPFVEDVAPLGMFPFISFILHTISMG